MKVTAAVLAVLSVLAGVRCDSCPCIRAGSTTYPFTDVLDCSNQFLGALPNACLQRSDSVSELWLSYNILQEIRSTTLADFTELRTLRLDNNQLTFVDPTAFEFMHKLEIFKIDHNLKLSLAYTTLSHQEKLRELSTIGCPLQTLPNISYSSHLVRADLRSSSLAALPLHGLLHPQLESSSFYMNLIGNMMHDMAVSSVLDLPADTKLYLDTDVLLWARTESERQLLLSKTWDVNIDLEASSRVCEEDGLPADTAICYE